MIFAAILAGGMGSRMGGTDTPKQFLTLGNKPVIIHTIEKFVINENIDKTIVLIPKNFINHTKDLINQYIPNNEDIILVEITLMLQKNMGHVILLFRLQTLLLKV